MLELNNVSKRVGSELHIDNVSVKFERGSLNVLLGPTLSGKTTLMRLMAGLDKPTSGDIRVDGNSVIGMQVRKRNVAMVYQQFINYPGFSVYDNIASPMRLAGIEKNEVDKRVREAAELLRLTDYLDRMPLQLSGGQQQRTAIARALVKEAELVLLDEPLANLDYKLREELRVELPKIFAKTGAVFVYATTEPHEALLLGGQSATLSEGRVTQFGNTIDIYNRPIDLQTAQTFADPPFNIASVVKSGTSLLYGEVFIGHVPEPASTLQDGNYVAAIRPHHLSMVETRQYHIPIQVQVGTSEITGSETFVHVNANGSRWVALAHGVHRVEPGEHIRVYLNPDTFYLFDSNDSLVHAPATLGEGH